MPDTPLGQIISIRSETDQEMIRGFTKNQKALRNQWLGKLGEKKNRQEDEESMNRLFDMALA